MVYEWAPHKDVLYHLYLEERKSLDEIMQHMHDTLSFSPSKRAYQTQFKRWGFPSKHNPAHRDVNLVERVKQLWDQNNNQREMLSTLNNEGYRIKERELMRLRAKHRWLLRIPNGMKSNEDDGFQPQQQAAGSAPTRAKEQDAVISINGAGTDYVQPSNAGIPSPTATMGLLTIDILRKRKERHDQLQAESDERWAAKKRRRRTRSYAGMPADPPGPPRFPSETTLDESKRFLSLDDQNYRRVRDDFQAICNEVGIVKKTLAGPDSWQAAKDRLIRESHTLQNTFWANTSQQEARALALDVICTDVTKRIRTMNSRMTIAEAKNVLGMNPEQSRKARNAFYAVLKADQFRSKLEAGDDHWQALKHHWIESSPFVKETQSISDPQHIAKARALDVLCRDVMKRLRDDMNKGASSKALWENSQTPNVDAFVGGTESIDSVLVQATEAGPPKQSTRPARPARSATAPSYQGPISDLQIDPTLFQGAGDYLPTFVPLSQPDPVAVYLRPHPQSQLHNSEKMWLGALATRTVDELHTLLSSRWSDAVIARVDGVEKGRDGQEISYLIEEDEELDAYLDHVQGRKAVFMALLRRRY